jgi:hypothetical protein
MLGGSNRRRHRTRSVIVLQLLDVRDCELKLVNLNNKFSASVTKHCRNAISNNEIMRYKKSQSLAMSNYELLIQHS